MTSFYKKALLSDYKTLIVKCNGSTSECLCNFKTENCTSTYFRLDIILVALSIISCMEKCTRDSRYVNPYWYALHGWCVCIYVFIYSVEIGSIFLMCKGVSRHVGALVQISIGNPKEIHLSIIIFYNSNYCIIF